ncbi:MAG: ribulose-phosphate 3-epimerase [Chloroflexota bacterium]
MPVYTIAPSILAADFGRMAEQVRDAQAAGADAVHVDVMDGQFVPEISFGRRLTELLREATSLPLDVHLMVSNPGRHIQPFAAAGAATITVHAEAAAPTSLPDLLRQIRRTGARAGLALKPSTPATVLARLYPLLDHILIMTVEPGYSGQPFQPNMLPKLQEIASTATQTTTIAVDGGIDPHTIKHCAQSGAGFFVAGSSVFSPNHSISAGIASLRAAIGAPSQNR